MHILITGGAGFIGSNLTRLALADGHEVSILDDLSTGYLSNLNGLKVDFHRASILDRPRLDAAMSEADAVVHLAALGSVPRSIEAPLASHHANATGTLNVLEAARAGGVGHLVAASSSSVYGLNPALPKNERAWVRPVSPYAVSKLATEQYVLAYQQSFGMDTLAFRLFNVYGPRQMPGHAYAAVIPTFLDALLRNRPLLVHGDGENSRDFTFVGVVVRLLLDAVTNKVAHPEPVNLAFGTNTTLTQLVKTIGQVTGRAPHVEHRDERPGDVRNSLIAAIESVSGRSAHVQHGPPRPGDVPASQADNTVLQSLFPHTAPVPLELGLKHTFAWFEERQ